MKITRMYVTPEIAEKMLAVNTNNRPLSKNILTAYSRDLKAGKWTESTDAVAIGADNVLYNGQHRLTAIVQTGVAVWLLVATGVPPESRMTMDAGWKRSAGANYLMQTGEHNAQRLFETTTAIAVLVKNRLSFTNNEKYDLFAKHETAIRWTETVFKASRGNPLVTAPVRAGFAVAYGACPDDVAPFCDRFLSGVGLQERDPALVLRNSLISFSATKNSLTNRRLNSAKVLRGCMAEVLGEQPERILNSEEGWRFFAAYHQYEVPSSDNALGRRVSREIKARGWWFPEVEKTERNETEEFATAAE